MLSFRNSCVTVFNSVVNDHTSNLCLLNVIMNLQCEVKICTFSKEETGCPKGLSLNERTADTYYIHLLCATYYIDLLCFRIFKLF